MSQSIGDLSLRCHFIKNKRSDGVNRLIDVYNNSTDEEKKLLSNECKIHFECCCCGNFFLNHLDLLTHKRIYCRTLCSTAAQSCSTITPDFAEKARAEQNDDQIKKEASPQQRSKGRAETSLSTKTDSQSPKRAKIILKRTDATSAANKHTEHCTLSQQKSTIIESLPYALVTVDTIPPDHVPVLIPQDRYGEMNLRNCKGDSSKNGVARKVGSEELRILERMDKYHTMMVDLSLLTCSHSDCKEKQPFSSLFTFAYHLTVKHNSRAVSNKRIPCYLCDFESQTYTALIEHLKSVHEQYYQEHITARSTSDELKRGRKGKQTKTAQTRGRSLSPLSGDFIETEESSDGSEEIGYDSAAVLELVANIEAENIELVVKDCMDYITAIVCDDVEKAQILEDRKYGLNMQLLPNESASRLQLQPKRRALLSHEEVEQVAKISRSVSKKQKYGSSICLFTARKRRVKNPVVDEIAGPIKTENDRKQRPSRQRRKPNWIDENYIIGFKNKRARHDDDIDLECAQPKRQSPLPSRTERSRMQSRIELKCTKNTDSRRSTSVELYDNIHRIQSEASSEETSNSSTPTPHEVTYSLSTNSHELNNNTTRSALPSSSTGLSSTGAKNTKGIMVKKTCHLQHTPRARRMKHRDEEEKACTSSKDAKKQATGNSMSNDRCRVSQSRRKQDLSTIHENNDDVMIVHYSNSEDSLPKDLSDAYFTETERDLFFSLIHPASPLSDDITNARRLMQCGDIIANIPERESSTKYVSHA